MTLGPGKYLVPLVMVSKLRLCLHFLLHGDPLKLTNWAAWPRTASKFRERGKFLSFQGLGGGRQVN